MSGEQISNDQAITLPDPGTCSCGKPASWEHPVWVRTPFRAFASPSCGAGSKAEPDHHAAVKVPMKQWEAYQDALTAAAADPWLEELQATMNERLAKMTPEQRAEWEAQEEAARQQCEEVERLDQQVRAAIKERHKRIARDRKAGVVCDLVDLGHVFGMAGAEAGRRLEALGLRELVNVDLAECDTPMGLERHTRDLPGASNRCTVEREDRGRGNVIRAVRDGLALWDDCELQEFWILAKVRPLLAPSDPRTGAELQRAAAEQYEERRQRNAEKRRKKK